MRQQIINEIEAVIEDTFEVGTTIFTAKTERSGIGVHVFVYIESALPSREDANKTTIDVIRNKMTTTKAVITETACVYGVYRILDADVIID